MIMVMAATAFIVLVIMVMRVIMIVAMFMIAVTGFFVMGFRFMFVLHWSTVSLFGNYLLLAELAVFCFSRSDFICSRFNCMRSSRSVPSAGSGI